MKKEKVTLKDYGFMRWSSYHLNNNMKVKIVFRIIIPCIVSVITSLIVMKKIIG